MLKWSIVGIGGFLGAISRYGLSGVAQRYANSSFPAGTLAVNIVGCFVIGGLMYFVEMRGLLTPETRLFLQVGFLGSFTTLSAVGYETFQLIRAGDFVLAVVNAGANVVLGVTAVMLGWIAARAFGL
jgi:CrcB protein